MRAKVFALAQALLLCMGLLVVTPSTNSTASTMASNRPVAVSGPMQESFGVQKPSSQPKPLAVWECITSWYGEDFDGLPTATGETYDMYGVTAAHPTLPLGSIVRVVNTRNHRSEVVRINDRGPYIEGRELDVSYEVARRLGFDQRGLAKVRLELLEVPSRPPAHHN